MTIRHLPRLDPDQWYVIDVNHGGPDRRPWEYRHLSLHGPNVEGSIEWSLLRHGFGLGVTVGRNGSESDLGLDIHLGRLANLYLRIRAPWTRWAQVTKEQSPDDWYEPRHTGVGLFPYRGCLILVRVDCADNGPSRTKARRREWKITSYMLLGKRHVDTVDGASGTTKIPLPEGVYDAAWVERINTAAYVGHRLGRVRDVVLGPQIRRYIDLTVEGGIPIEGKGENSWDCGMDGLFGCGGSSVESAVGAAVAHVLRGRDRYGGPHDLTRPMTVSEAAERVR